MNSITSANSEVKKTEATFYHLSSGETIEEPVTRFELFNNSTDTSNTYVEIEFYLPEPVNAKLILMDSDKTDAMYLIDKELKAGRHIYRSAIMKDELLKYKYYYKLEAYGYNEVREMRYAVR